MTHSLIGRTLDRYRITARLGGGGMGMVWRAEHTLLGQTVALKLLAPELADSPEARQRLILEARAAARLEHPHIARVLDAGEADGDVFIVYGFVEGESLARRCERGPLPLAEVVELARGVVQALAYAHAHGVLHRDVTAGNVMVTPEGSAVLVDFGLARAHDRPRITRTQAPLGTPGFMAPEVLRGEPADERSDLYSLGAVGYQMLTGKPPFADGPPEALYHRALNEAVRPPSGLRPELPASLERVVLRLLAREPEDRYPSASEALEALGEVRLDVGPSWLEVMGRRWARRWRDLVRAVLRMFQRKVGVAALGTLVLIALGAWFAASRGWIPGMAVRPPVLAVLPFENTSEDPEAVAYLAEGLGDELVIRLSAARGYRVLPWLTTRRAARASRSVQLTAKSLGADMVLLGSFRGDEERLRVTVSLVDGRSGVVRWSESLDQSVLDLMTVQAEIVTRVARTIEGALTSVETQALSARPSESPEAYAYYLQGANYLASNDLATWALAQPHFEKALELDPRLAEAYVGRGAVLVDEFFRGISGIASLRAARRDFERALELRPGMSRAQQGLVSVAFESGRSEDMLRIASDVARRGDSEVEGLLTRGWACTFSGLLERALPLFERVLELDPGNREAAWFLTFVSQWAGRQQEALERGKAYIRRFGEDPEIYTWMGVASDRLGAHEDASLYLGRALELFGSENSNLYLLTTAVVHFEEHGREAFADSLLTHWIPRLRSRWELARDNYRVLWILTSLEGMSRDTTACLALAQHCHDLLAREPDVNPGVIAGAVYGYLIAADEIHLASLIRALDGRELSALAPFEGWLERTLTAAVRDRFERSTVIRELRQRVRSRVAELDRRYGDAVALRARRS